MKIKTTTILTSLFLILISLSVDAQNFAIGATLNPGMSKVTSDLPMDDEDYVKFALSGNGGIFLEYKMGTKSTLGVEALWVQIRGKEGHYKRTLMFSNGDISEIENETRVYSNYFGVPVYYRIAVGKLGIKLGAQSMFFVNAGTKYEARGVVNGLPYRENTEGEIFTFDLIDVGPKIGIDYQLNNSFRVRADFYHGLTDITPDNFLYERRNIQLTVGVQYSFLSF